jgi:hypothetical protein
MTRRHPYIRRRSNDYDSQVKCFDVSNVLIWENESDEGIGKHKRWPFSWGSLLHEYHALSSSYELDDATQAEVRDS